MGFHFMTTFYNLFQTMVGMTPTQYRNRVQELEKSKTASFYRDSLFFHILLK